MSALSDQMRIEFLEGDNKRDEGLTTPNDVVRYNNIQYGSDPKWNSLDVYRPKINNDILPVIVIVHGGGWVYGTKETYQYYGMNLAERGFAVVNPNYRLAPENKFPSPLEDLNQTVNWIINNQELYRFDVNNIFMVGDSAGGNILGMYASICSDHSYAQNFSTISIPNGFKLRAIGMNCGAYRIFEADGHITWPNDVILMKDYLPNGGDEYERSLMNVVDHISKDFPPTYIADAYGDFLKVEVPLLEQQLEKYGVQHRVKIYGNEENPLYHVFMCNIREPEAAVCNDDECHFFRTFM